MIRATQVELTTPLVVTINDDTQAVHRFVVAHVTGWDRQATTIHIHTTTGVGQPIRCDSIDLAHEVDDVLRLALR